MDEVRKLGLDVESTSKATRSSIYPYRDLRTEPF